MADNNTQGKKRLQIFYTYIYMYIKPYLIHCKQLSNDYTFLLNVKIV